jgi:hypothetical protein
MPSHKLKIVLLFGALLLGLMTFGSRQPVCSEESLPTANAVVSFQNVDWSKYLGGRFSFFINQIGMPDQIYPKRYSADDREDDIVLYYRGAGVDMRAYVWDNNIYRFYFSKEHRFNIYQGVRTNMNKDQIESLLGPVNKITEKNLHLWKSGQHKIIVTFDDKNIAKEIMLSLER